MSCCGFQGATGLTSEADFTIASNLLYDEILINSNLSFFNSSNYTSNSSNYLFGYSSNNSNSLYNNTGTTSNDFFNFSNQILSYINSNEESNYIYFNNSNNTIINSNSELFVYHNSNFLIPLDYSGYWSVEDKLTSNIIETNLIKFDFSLLQSALTGISSLISTIQAEISALEASDIAQLAGLVALEQQIESINAILSSLDFSMNSLYPLEIVDKNIFLNYNSNQFNLDGCNLNIQSIYSSNSPSNPHQTNGSISVINNQFAYFKWIRNGSITFPQNLLIDFLVVAAGGNGGPGFYGGGGGAGEVIYKASHSISAGTYQIQVGNSLNKISRIYQGGTNIVSASGGGDGGFYEIVKNSIFNYYLFNNTIGVINYVNNVNLNEGTNKLIFNEGYIEVNGVKDKSYPLIKRTIGGTNTTLNPIYWYKFISSNFLINDGTTGSSGNLINYNNITPDTLNFIKNNASCSFNGTNQYFSITYNNNLRTIQTTTGLSISFWVYPKPKTPQNYFIFSIDDGYDTGLRFANFFNDISIQFTVRADYNTFISTNPNISYANNKWYFITITFATNYDIKLYIDNELVESGANFQLPNVNLNRFILGGGISNFYFEGNIDDFRFYHTTLNTDEINELYKGSIIVNKLATSGGSGGGGCGGIFFDKQTGANAGTPWNITYSKLNNGSNGVIDAGGDGGSALISGDGYTELITDNDLIVGKGGYGNGEVNYYPETKSNYGDGGDGYGGLGFQGIIIMKVPYIPLEHTFTGFTYWSNVKNVSVNNPIELFAPNSIGLKKDSSLTLDGSGNLSVVKTATTPIIITGNNFSLSYDASLTKIGNNLSVVKTATTPIIITNNNFSLSYDASLTIIGNNLSVVKTATLPLTITGNNFALNYDSTLTLNGNNLSVASASGSKWTQSGNHIYNNNIGSVGINTTTPTGLFEICPKLFNYQPIAWYFSRMTNVDIDFMGNYNLSQYNISTSTDGVDYEYSVSFNGTSSYLTSATNLGLNGGSFTICFWIKKGTENDRRAICQLGTSSGVNQRFAIYIDSNNTINVFLSNYITTAPYNDYNTWVHLAVVFATDYTLKIYRNGVLLANATLQSSPINFYNFFQLGRSSLFSSFFSGKLYDFRIYNVALNIDNINAIYNYKNSMNGLSLKTNYNSQTHRLDFSPHLISNNRLGYKFKILNSTINKDILYFDDLGNITINANNDDTNGLILKNINTYPTASSKIEFINDIGSSSLKLYTSQGTTAFKNILFIENHITNGSIYLKAGTSSVFLEGATGNVGIGMITPNYKLHISGDINFTGNLLKNGSVYVPANATNAVNAQTASSCSGNSATTNYLNGHTGIWHTSTEGTIRLYFASQSHTYYGTGAAHIFRQSDTTSTCCQIDSDGISAKILSVSITNTDMCCVQQNQTLGNYNFNTIRTAYNTFTGFHRCFIEDELFDINNHQKFKDEYEGRVVVSIGKIKTERRDLVDIPDWTIFENKEAIHIEEAIPIIQLSRKRKDKSVYGVLGSSTRSNSAPNRMIVNSLGEGGIFVVNTNGNLENGDLLQTSAHLGYAERQNDDIIRNYSIGKIVMDCNFELNSPYYKCEIIDEELDLRRAFVASVYYCG